MRHALPPAWTLILALLAAGCLPSSCQRTTSRDVSPADSLSRQIAQALTPDTLTFEHALESRDDHPLEYPRTVRFASSERLVVSDARRNSVFYFDASGTFQNEFTWDSLSVPYLVGLYGDTLAVFSPGTRRVDYVVNGILAHTIPTPADLPASALQYAVATSSMLYLKAAGKDTEAFLAMLDRNGDIVGHRSMKGSTWRNSGTLRIWGDSLLSFSGFFPVVDVLPLTLQGPTDSLALKGFDSPMLARTYSFTQGKGRGAPLLTSSATAEGRYLFVLNMRPGWLQIDVYDRTGQLCYILIEPQPGYNKEYYPIDLAVQHIAKGYFLFAAAIIEPEPIVEIYSWQAPLGID